MLHPGVPSSAIAVLLMTLGLAHPAQSATIELVIAKDANELEWFAASELERYLKELFRVSATTVSSPSPAAESLFLLGTEGWGMADYRPLIDPLAKLKFNRIRVGSSPSQPFLDLKIKGLTFPWKGMMMQYWTDEPLTKVLPEDRAGYARALAAVRKVPTPARPEGKTYVEYWIGRPEFAVKYIEAVEAVKRGATAEKVATVAKTKGDSQGHLTNLRVALQQAQFAQMVAVEAIEAFAGVAKNRADLGAIATMAEFVYRPLKQKAEELQAECESFGEAAVSIQMGQGPQTDASFSNSRSLASYHPWRSLQ